MATRRRPGKSRWPPPGSSGLGTAAAALVVLTAVAVVVLTAVAVVVLTAVVVAVVELADAVHPPATDNAAATTTRSYLQHRFEARNLPRRPDPE